MPEMLNNQETDEEWLVIMSSGGKYTLSKLQAIYLKEAIARNKRQVMFETFMISIPYVVEFYRVKTFLKGAKQLPAEAYEKPYKPIPPDKWEKFKQEIYGKIKHFIF